jgi:hypothetical protein
LSFGARAEIRFGPSASVFQCPHYVGFPLTATIKRTSQIGQEVPAATDAAQQTVSQFDHLVGAGEQRRRHSEAEIAPLVFL